MINNKRKYDNVIHYMYTFSIILSILKIDGKSVRFFGKFSLAVDNLILYLSLLSGLIKSSTKLHI